MKKIICTIILVVLAVGLAGCSNSKLEAQYPPQSIGGETVEGVLASYAESFSNVDYTTFTGYEILPYVTKEWGKIWLDELSSQYVKAYKKNKFVREYQSASVSDVKTDGDSATAELSIYSLQKEPSIKSCESVSEKITLVKIDGNWFVDKVETK